MTRLSRKWIAKFTAVVVSLSLALMGMGVIGVARADVSIGGARDCDSNAIIYCGAGTASQLAAKYNNGDGRNSVASIHNIFSYFGISSAMVQSMPTTAVAGSVTSSGQVFVNSKLVATNALTGGRQFISGSTPATFNGTVFYTRPPSVSFASSPLGAFVVMSGGQFKFAVLASCGNAVKATPVAPPAPAPAPTPKPTPIPTVTPSAPNYTINKLVAPHGSNNFASEIEVQPNTNVDYKITIASTGNAAVQSLVVKDTLPSDDTYVSGTLKRDSTSLSSDQAAQFFGGGFTVGSLPNGTATTFTFEALAGANQNNNNCNPETLPNVTNMTATNLPPESATATVSVVCAPKPTPTPPPVTPAVVTKVSPPTQLVNTGPGAVVGVFIASTIAGAIGYRVYLARRLSN